MVTHVQAMLQMHMRGAIVFDYGNNLRGQALEAGETHALDFPGFVPAYIRPLFCTNDPGTGVMRHVDAGYEEAIECAKEMGVKIPML